MPYFDVSLYCHGNVRVWAETEDGASEKASKVPHDQVCWEDEYNDMEAFPVEGK